jgi:hypothetical protein
MITGWIYGDAMEQLRLAIAEHGPSSEQAAQPPPTRASPTA